jgi:hypothetical protein
VTWKDSYLPAVLALGLVLTEPLGKAQQTNTPKRLGQTSQTPAATTPKVWDAHAQPGNAVNLSANAVTNPSVPLVTESAGEAPRQDLALAKKVNSSSPQLAPAGSGKKRTANGALGTGSTGFSDLTGVSQSKDSNVSDMRVGSDQQPQTVPKGRQAGGSPISTQAAALPGNAIQATPTNPPRRKKPAAPPHQP